MTATFNRGEVEGFLTAFFDGQPGLTQICSTGDWSGEFFPSTPWGFKAAADYAERLDRSKPQGIYFRATTVAARPESGRGGAADTLAFPAGWADLDYGTVGHRGANLPPTAEDARNLIGEAGLPEPTILIHSGGGLYPLWKVSGLTGTEQAAQLSVNIQAAILAASQRHGWDYGTGVSDLARVLRLPGSVNRKTDIPRACQIIGGSAVTFTVEAFPVPVIEPKLPPRTDRQHSPTGPGVFDAFADTAEWQDILTPADWTFVGSESSGAELWLRPGGADSEYSARCFTHNMVVHSEAADLPAGSGQRLTKARVFAWLYHDGDESTAAKDLVKAAFNSGGTTAARSMPSNVLDAIKKVRDDMNSSPSTPSTKYESNEKNEVTKKTPTLHESAYHGVLGKVVRKLEPATEASPAAMLVQLIACVGAYTGDRVTTLIGGSLHPVRIWPLVIGPTSSGRKGESRAQVQRFVSSFSSFNSYFVDQESGLSTGEGLLHRLQNDESDTGKTLIVWETEFGRPLAASRREGNTLSHVLRDLWDDGKGSSMTKADPVTVTGAHLVVVGHITPKELRVKLTEVDISGGLANRFLTFWARRTKLLAEQVEEPDTRQLAQQLDETLTWVSRLGTARIPRAKSAADYWRRIYQALADQEVEGPLGELLARAPAYVLRLALAYALMDRQTEIGVVHLRAGLAMVSYAIDTATYVFGDTAGTGDLGKLSQALRSAGPKGMARTDISKLFSGNRPADKLTALVVELVSSGDAKEHTVATGQRGRDEIRTVWVNRAYVHPLGALLDEPVPTNDESNEKNHAEEHDVNGDADSGPDDAAVDLTVDDNGRPYGVWRVSGQRAS